MKNSVERSIIKTYRKTIWKNFVKAIKTYELIVENDAIAVCMSGGKDSFLLAKCLQELQRHHQVKFSLKFLVMDPGYDKNVRAEIIKTAEILKVPIQIFTTDIFAQVKGNKNACYLCAKKRRGYLYYFAKQLNCNKIALGHHFDDVIETILLNIFYNGQHQTMMPKVWSNNFENIELIRPLYFVEEQAIIKWVNYNKLSFINCACSNIQKADSKRLEMKNLIKQLSDQNIDIKKNIFQSSENVNLDALIGYKKHTISHNFLADYCRKNGK